MRLTWQQKDTIFLIVAVIYRLLFWGAMFYIGTVVGRYLIELGQNLNFFLTNC